MKGKLLLCLVSPFLVTVNLFFMLCIQFLIYKISSAQWKSNSATNYTLNRLNYFWSHLLTFSCKYKLENIFSFSFSFWSFQLYICFFNHIISYGDIAIIYYCTVLQQSGFLWLSVSIFCLYVVCDGLESLKSSDRGHPCILNSYHIC